LCLGASSAYGEKRWQPSQSGGSLGSNRVAAKWVTVMPLTDSAVRNAKPGEKQRKLSVVPFKQRRM